MEEIVQEQSHVCKICGKHCVSGRSLGGHMRLHLAEIYASKKKTEFDHSSVLKRKEESNSFSTIQKRIKTGFLDNDLINNSYGLRNHPKKSYRFDETVMKTEFSEFEFSCKECGKEFATTRALSGHMRCHSMKRKEMIHECKTCGREFDSPRAMFGHMKTHSKKSRKVAVYDDEDDYESVGGLAVFDTFCPVRRKRSRIRYKTPPHQSFSSLNESVSAVNEVSELEIAAATLVMLSRGVGGPIRLDSCMEVFGGGSEYFGEKIATGNNVTGLVADNGMDEGFESRVGLMHCVENDPEFGEEVSGDSLGSDELNGPSVKLESAYELKSSDPSNFTDSTEIDETISEFLKTYCVEKPSITGSDNSSYVSPFAEKQSNKQIDQETEVVGVATLGTSKRKKHQCAVCFAVFSSGQALGGHKRAHYKGVTEPKIEEVTGVNQDVVGIKDLYVDLNFPANAGNTNADAGRNLWWVESSSQVSSTALLLN